MNLPEYMPTFEHEGRLYRVVYDEIYETRGSYSYDTEEETRAVEDEEIANLASGKWVAVGVIVTMPCPGHDGGPHCGACAGFIDVDSLWGIVCEQGEDKVKATVLSVLGVTA